MLPSCCHNCLTLAANLAVTLEKYGVPGGVRTCNLPLRSGGLARALPSQLTAVERFPFGQGILNLSDQLETWGQENSCQQLA